MWYLFRRRLLLTTISYRGEHLCAKRRVWFVSNIFTFNAFYGLDWFQHISPLIPLQYSNIKAHTMILIWAKLLFHFQQPCLPSSPVHRPPDLRFYRISSKKQDALPPFKPLIFIMLKIFGFEYSLLMRWFTFPIINICLDVDIWRTKYSDIFSPTSSSSQSFWLFPSSSRRRTNFWSNLLSVIQPMHQVFSFKMWFLSNIGIWIVC